MEAASAAYASRDEMPRSSPHSCRGGNQLIALSRVGVVTSYPHALRREVKLCRVAPSWACLAEAQGTHLPTSPYVSLHLPTSPYVSLYLGPAAPRPKVHRRQHPFATPTLTPHPPPAPPAPPLTRRLRRDLLRQAAAGPAHRSPGHPMCPALQPYVPRPATLCDPPCNPNPNGPAHRSTGHRGELGRRRGGGRRGRPG